MKRTFLSMLLALMTIVAMAVPAKRGQVRTLTLTDGTTVQATLVGDEYGHYWLASDGRTFQSTEDATIFRQVDAKTIREKAQTRRNNVNAKRMKKLQRQQERRKIGQFGDYTGQKKCIIILVNFSDVKFKDANNKALFERIANEENFSYGNFKGSMYDYFKAQSGGQFELTFDVAGPYTMTNTQSYYGSNDSDGNDKHPGELVRAAVQKANADFDFKQYDWDGDGYVDQVYVVYAGKGEADGGAENTIWPHAWSLSAASYYGDGAGAITVDGVVVDSYACGSELNGSSNISGIGTMCHEFSHCLGYPDFYDTDYSGGDGMSSWDLMDMGSYNGNGYRPAGYTGYERWMAGWQEPIELNAGTVKVEGMKGLQNGGEFYVMYNDGHPDEYYMLENRTKTGWDTSLPGSGLLVIHVDYDANVWANNQPNDNPNHQRMTWVPADNNRSSYSMANDPFPYGSHTSFDNTTTPAASLYNKNTDGTKFLNKGIYDISKSSNGNISFTFKGASNVAVPTFSPEAGTYVENVTVSISADDGADIYYTTDGSTPTTSSAQYTEPIFIEATTTVKAIAVKDNDQSDVAQARYVVRTTPTGDYIWKEDWQTATAGKAVENVENDNATYTGDNGAYCKIYANNYAGGTSPELLIPKFERQIAFTSTIFLGGIGGDLPLTFKSNKTLDVTSSTTGVTIENEGKEDNTYSYTVSVPEGTQDLVLFFSTATNENARIDDILLGMPGTVKKNPGLKFSNTSVSALPNQSDFTPPTLINPYDVAVTFASSDTNLAQVDESTGDVVIGSVEGEVTITASFAGDEEYRASSASYTITIAKLYAELSYAQTEYTVFVGDGFETPELQNPLSLPVTYSSSDETVAKVNAQTGAVTLKRVTGTATITASFAGNDEYAANTASYTIVVEKKTAELWFDESEYFTTIGETFTAPALNNPAELPVTFSSSDETLAKVNAQTGAVTLGNKSGIVAIMVAFAGSEEYKPASTSYVINIERKEAELWFAEPEYNAFVGDDFTPPALTNPANLPVTFSSSDETLAKVNEKTGAVTIGNVSGTVAITAAFNGNDEYKPCDTFYIIRITKKQAELWYDEQEYVVSVGEDFPTPTLTNPHQLPVTFESSDETLAKVDAQTGAVTLGSETGRVTITASFAGDDYYFEGTASYTIAIVPNPNIFEVEGVVFKIQEDGSVAIIDGSNASGAYTIPQTVTHEGVEYTVTAIAAGAFKGNTALTEVVIPETIASIGAEAFAGCTGLEAIYVYAEDPILLTEDGEECSVFAGVDKSTCKLYVFWPNGEKYSMAYGWSEFENIIEMETEGITAISRWMTEGHHVYNLNGQAIQSNKVTKSQSNKVTKSQSNLPKGIYIVDGHKIVVK